MLPAPSLLALIFIFVASYQDYKDREISDFIWVASLPVLSALFVVFFRDFLINLIPAALLVPASYYMAKKGLMGEADPLALLIVALGFPQTFVIFPAYLIIFFLALLSELAAFGVIIAGKDGRGAPSPFTYRIKKDSLNNFWLPRDDKGRYLYDINDPRPIKELMEESKKKIEGDTVWATPILPFLPFIFISCLVVFFIMIGLLFSAILA